MHVPLTNVYSSPVKNVASNTRNTYCYKIRRRLKEILGLVTLGLLLIPMDSMAALDPDKNISANCPINPAPGQTVFNACYKKLEYTKPFSSAEKREIKACQASCESTSPSTETEDDSGSNDVIVSGNCPVNLVPGQTVFNACYKMLGYTKPFSSAEKREIKACRAVCENMNSSPDTVTDSGENDGGNTVEQTDDRYLSVVKRFADIALDYGRDNYGPKRTPLFVDSLSVTEYRPYRWGNRQNSRDQSMYPAEQISANFAINGQLHITLHELTKLSGDPKYGKAAREAAAYAMDNLVDPGGLFYWGHHETYDALNDMIFGLGSPPVHEMKTMVPAFRYLYSLNPSAVKKNIEQYMSMGIKDWNKLTYTRHLVHHIAYKNPWENVSQINTNQKVPVQSSVNMLQPENGIPFITSGIAYYDLTGDERAYKVAYQILKRFMDMRDPKTGLGPGTYAVNGKTNTVVVKRYRYIIPALLKGAELLGESSDKGKELLKWAVEELTASSNLDYGPTKSWNYALAYRLTGNNAMWDTARKILKGYGLGDIGNPSGDGLDLSFGTFRLQPMEKPSDRSNNMNAFVIHALVELYESTGQKAFLDLAENVADKIMESLYDNGLFVRQKDGLYARLADMIPLAFLHLAAAKRGVELEVDSVWPRYLYLRVRHTGEDPDKLGDNLVVYCTNKYTGKCN